MQRISELDKYFPFTYILPNLQVMFPVFEKLEPTTFTFVFPLTGPYSGCESKRNGGL